MPLFLRWHLRRKQHVQSEQFGSFDHVGGEFASVCSAAGREARRLARDGAPPAQMCPRFDLMLSGMWFMNMSISTTSVSASHLAAPPPATAVCACWPPRSACASAVSGETVAGIEGGGGAGAGGATLTERVGRGCRNGCARRGDERGGVGVLTGIARSAERVLDLLARTLVREGRYSTSVGSSLWTLSKS